MFGKKENPNEKSAQLSALKKIKAEMEAAMKSGLGKKDGLKKVTVASDSEEGLEEGLEKAKEIIEGEEELGVEEESEDEGMEDVLESEEMSEDEDTEEEIDAEIERLLALKEKLQS